MRVLRRNAGKQMAGHISLDAKEHVPESLVHSLCMQLAGLAPDLECLLNRTGLSSWNKELVTASQCDGLVDFTQRERPLSRARGRSLASTAGLFWALYAGEPDAMDNASAPLVTRVGGLKGRASRPIWT